jgi:hypothetical protein
MRLIDSTPHAIAMSYWPVITPCAANMAAVLTRSTLPINRGSRNMLGKTRCKQCVSGHVVALLADLRNTSGDHIIYERRV